LGCSVGEREEGCKESLGERGVVRAQRWTEGFEIVQKPETKKRKNRLKKDLMLGKVVYKKQNN